jgi:hypothetical protein
VSVGYACGYRIGAVGQLPVTHHVRIRPLRLRGYDALNDCATSKVIGYRAVCSCGWTGKTTRSVDSARNSARGHERDSRPRPK